MWTSTFHFSEENGGTRVDLDVACRNVTFFAKVMGLVMGPMIRKMMKKCMAQDFEDLRGAIESV